MDPSNLPTLETLQSVRQQMLSQMEEATTIFPVDENTTAFRTFKAALKCIEDLINTQDTHIAEAS